MSKVRILDLFAGAGGLTLGFEQAGFSPGVMVDSCAMAIETLDVNFNHRNGVALERDLSDITPLELERDLLASKREPRFDLIIGGPPCQGWSTVGRGKLRSLGYQGHDVFEDPRNRLYKSFLDFVGYFQPAVCVMENVPGMMSVRGVSMAEQVARNLENRGYNVSWQLVNAVDFGVPQIRQRVFFVGVRRDQGVRFEFRSPKTDSGKRRFPLVTVRDAISDLPPIKNGNREWIKERRRPEKISAFAREMRSGADLSKIFDHVCRTNNKQDLEAFRLLKQGGWYRDLPKRLKRYRDDIFEDKYKKLFWDRASWCVTAHLSRDGYTHIHPSQARTISIREAARLQSFPDCHYFAGCMGDKFRLIGNAVPPLLARVIAEDIRDQIFKKRRKRAAPHRNRPANANIRRGEV